MGEKSALKSLNTECLQRTAIGQVKTQRYSPGSKYEPILMKNMWIKKECLAWKNKKCINIVAVFLAVKFCVKQFFSSSGLARRIL